MKTCHSKNKLKPVLSNINKHLHETGTLPLFLFILLFLLVFIISKNRLIEGPFVSLCCFENNFLGVFYSSFAKKPLY